MSLRWQKRAPQYIQRNFPNCVAHLDAGAVVTCSPRLANAKTKVTTTTASREEAKKCTNNGFLR